MKVCRELQILFISAKNVYVLIFVTSPRSARAIAPPLCSMAPLDLRPVQYSYEITDTMAKFSKFCTEIMNVFWSFSAIEF